MSLFIDPDPRELTALPDGIPCPGLEALTGADFVIARIDHVSPVEALPVHIANRSLFCNRKLGYDAIGDFNQALMEIARMQAHRIPTQQCFILPIGTFYPDPEGYLRIKGTRPLTHTRKIKYKTYLKLEAEWGYSGVQVRRLGSQEELGIFIEAQLEELEMVLTRGKKSLLPKTQAPQFLPENALQPLEEVDKGDWRYFMCAGLDGFGPTLATRTQEYLQIQLPHITPSVYITLKVLSDETPEGKPVHKIKGWGDKSRSQLRRVLGLLDGGFNLGIDDPNGSGFAHGWYGALRGFQERVEAGENANKVFKDLMRQANEFYKEEGV